MRQFNNDEITTDENTSEGEPQFLHKSTSDIVLDNLLRAIRNDSQPNGKNRKMKSKLSTTPDNATRDNGSSMLTGMQENGKFRTLLLLFLLLFSGITMWLVKTTSANNTALQVGIAEDIIRFHVIANSDSEEDQAIKLTVKNTLVADLAPFLQDAGTIEQARTILSDKLIHIKKLAESTLQQNGFNYPVTVSLEDNYFPLKVYGDYTFPPGTYEALRVQIGEAKGKNWWCVMFPPLCFVDETYSIVDESSQEKLKHLLTEEEYDTLISQKTPVKVKFKLIEAIKEFFN